MRGEFFQIDVRAWGIDRHDSGSIAGAIRCRFRASIAASEGGVRAFQISAVVMGVSCAGVTAPQRACLDYAAVFAEVATNDCSRGTLEDNVVAFKEAARVGSDCELVTGVRDVEALEGECFSWMREEVRDNCEWLDDGSVFLDNLPDACREQLQVGTGL